LPHITKKKKKGPIKKKNQVPEDTTFEKDFVESLCLYCLEETEEGVESTEVQLKDNKLECGILKDDRAYILDCGNEVYAWQGVNISEEVRTTLRSIADQILNSEEERENWVRVERITQGAEPVLFREKFSDWPDLARIKTPRKVRKYSSSQQGNR